MFASGDRALHCPSLTATYSRATDVRRTRDLPLGSLASRVVGNPGASADTQSHAWADALTLHAGAPGGADPSVKSATFANHQTAVAGVTVDPDHLHTCVHSLHQCVTLVLQVDSEAGVRGVLAELRGAAGRVSRQSSYYEAVPVGLDAEWEPYARGHAATPVATLQIAIRSRAWVLDMQALCRSVRKNRCDRPGVASAHQLSLLCI